MQTRLSPHWRWESSARTKCPSPCSPRRTGAALLFEFLHRGAPPVLYSSIYLSTSPAQVHLLLQRPAVKHHQNEQQPSVSPPDPPSITTELPNRRRSVFNPDFKMHSFLFGIVLECCVSVSYRFLPLREDLPVPTAGLHLRCLVRILQVVRLQCVHWTDIVYTTPVPVFRCQQVCAYTPVTAVYPYCIQLRHVWAMLCVRLELVWP